LVFFFFSTKLELWAAAAAAGAELAEEYTGDVLAHKFQELETHRGADEDLTALKRKMGMLPPEPEPAPAQQAVRVEQAAHAVAEQAEQAEQDELARALAELEAQEQQELRMKR
jgi:phage shock protein A